jgi:hypothetical protein
MRVAVATLGRAVGFRLSKAVIGAASGPAVVGGGGSSVTIAAIVAVAPPWCS